MVKEGSVTILRPKHMQKFLGPCPLSVKLYPFSIILERVSSLYLPIEPFSIKIFAKAC